MLERTPWRAGFRDYGRLAPQQRAELVRRAQAALAALVRPSQVAGPHAAVNAHASNARARSDPPCGLPPASAAASTHVSRRLLAHSALQNLGRRSPTSDALRSRAPGTVAAMPAVGSSSTASQRSVPYAPLLAQALTRRPAMHATPATGAMPLRPSVAEAVQAAGDGRRMQAPAAGGSVGSPVHGFAASAGHLCGVRAALAPEAGPVGGALHAQRAVAAGDMREATPAAPRSEALPELASSELQRREEIRVEFSHPAADPGRGAQWCAMQVPAQLLRGSDRVQGAAQADTQHIRVGGMQGAAGAGQSAPDPAGRTLRSSSDPSSGMLGSALNPGGRTLGSALDPGGRTLGSGPGEVAAPDGAGAAAALPADRACVGAEQPADGAEACARVGEEAEFAGGDAALELCAIQGSTLLHCITACPVEAARRGPRPSPPLFAMQNVRTL